MLDNLHSADDPSAPAPKLPNPLWLPRGSVRAVIALGVIGVWAALEVGALGAESSDAVRSMAVAVAAGYGFLRFRAADRPEDRSGR